MKLHERPSPNHGPRAGSAIDMLVLHYTGMKSAAEALERLCAPEAQVSAHYVIDEDGTVWRLVAEERRAWHAGVSSWRGRADVNDASVGIELVNPGHEWGYRPFPEPQMAALEELCRGILARHPIPRRNVVGHSDVAPLRKTDPGELFDWARLGRHGIGLWLADRAAPNAPLQISEAQRLLAAIGYAVPLGREADSETVAVITAFQRHFRPRLCDGALDLETAGRIQEVAALCGKV